MDKLSRRIVALISELKRRRVFHVAVAYAVGAWIVIQVASVVFPALRLPSWTLTLVVVLAVVGFPIALALAWTFELTERGIERTKLEEEEPVQAFRASLRLRGALLVAVTLLSAALGWASWQLWLGPGATELQGNEGPGADLDARRVAVLYFDDHSRNQDLGYLAAGLTESLIHELSQVEALEVVSRHGVKPFRERDVPPDSIARILRAGSLVEGSVQGYGDSVQVTVQLVDARTQSHLESLVLTRSGDDLFQLQRELAEEVSRLLRRRMGREIELRRRRAATGSNEALDLVWRAEELRKDAVQLLAEGRRQAAGRLLAQGDSLLARAEERDPAWAEPVVLRGRLASERVRPYSPAFGEEDRRWIRTGIRHAERALELDPDHPGALELRGTLRYWLSRHATDSDQEGRLLDAAEADLRSAVEADPSFARAWSSLSELLQEGRDQLAEAHVAAENAYQADAFLDDAERVLVQLTYTSLNLEKYEEAWRWCQTGRRRFPDNLDLVGVEFLLLASRQGPPPDVERAWSLVDRVAELTPTPEDSAAFVSVARMQTAAVLARAGWEDSARSVLRRARRQAPPGTEAWLAYDEAHTRLLLGQRQRALELVEAYLRANPGERGTLRSDPWFKPLRDDSAFRELTSPGG